MSDGAAHGGSRIRLFSLLAPPLIAALLFTAWAQPWVILTLDDGVRITATGDRAAAVLPAIAVASLALTSALALASPRVRPVLGVLLALFGVLAVVVSARVLADPVGSAASGVTALTGVEGERSVRELVDAFDVTAWPAVAVALGVVAAAVGVMVMATARQWPARAPRFERPAEDPRGPIRDGHAPLDADSNQGSMGAWDALSDGRDPTAR